MRVNYRITHPRPADLRVDLVGPDGQRYRLRNAGQTGSVADVTSWPAVNQPRRNGTWLIDVIDLAPGAAGRLNHAEIAF
ncbi:proprotein convertase P-domain-containing protein [Actinokineospora sp. 24-640]